MLLKTDTPFRAFFCHTIVIVYCACLSLTSEPRAWYLQVANGTNAISLTAFSIRKLRTPSSRETKCSQSGEIIVRQKGFLRVQLFFECSTSIHELLVH